MYIAAMALASAVSNSARVDFTLTSQKQCVQVAVRTKDKGKMVARPIAICTSTMRRRTHPHATRVQILLCND